MSQTHDPADVHPARRGVRRSSTSRQSIRITEVLLHKLRRILFPFLALITIVTALTPIHIRFENIVAAPSTSIGSPVLSKNSISSQMTFLISTEGSGSVSLGFPQTGNGSVVSPVPSLNSTGWSETDTGYQIKGPSSQRTFSTEALFVLIPVIAVEGSPRLKIDSGGGPTYFNLEGVLSHTSLFVSSSAEVFEESSFYLFETKDLKVPDKARMSASFGPIDVSDELTRNGTQVHLGASKPIKEALINLVHFLPIAFSIAALLTISFVFGRALLLLFGSGIRDTSIATALGVSTLGSSLGGLNYLLPAKNAVVLLMILCLLVLATVLKRFGVQNFLRVEHGGLDRVTLAVFGLLFVFPSISTRSLNVGFLQTDTYDYFHLGHLFWTKSIPNAGTDWGWGLRTLDSTFRSTIEHVFSLAPWESAVSLRITLALLALAVLSSALRATGATRARSRVVLMLFCALSPLHGLWFEGYLSRENFAYFLTIGLCVAVLFCSSSRNVTVIGKTDLLILGLVLSPAVGIVPPFMVLVPTLLLVSIFSRNESSLRSSFVQIAYFLLGLVPLSLVNLWWMFGSEVSSDYAKAVEGIGRNIIVPFYSTSVFPAALLGLIPFHLNDSSLFGGKLASWVPPQIQSAHDLSELLSNSWTVVCIAILCLTWIFLKVNRTELVLTSRLLTTYILVTVIATVCLLSFWETQSFFFLMWCWTLGPSLLLALSLLPAPKGRSLATVSMIAFASLAAVNLLSVTTTTTRWLDSPYSESAKRTHFDLSSDILSLSDVIDASTYSASIQVPASELTGTDDDRVAVNFIDLVLSQKGIVCDNCVYDARNGSVLYTTTVVPESELVLVVGGKICPPSFKNVDTLRAITVCGRT